MGILIALKENFNAFKRPIEIEDIDHDPGVSINICDFNTTCDISLALVQADKAACDGKKQEGTVFKYYQ